MNKYLLVVLIVIPIFSLTGCGVESKAKEAVRSEMKDGESARFKELVVSYKSYFVCGKVNAKNSFGAYIGWQKFVVSTSSNSSSELVFFEKQNDFESLWSACNL